MSETIFEGLPDGENLTSYRLGRVEKTLEHLNQKLDGINAVKETVLIHQEKISSLEKSRDRLIIACTGLFTGVTILGLQQLFNVVGV